MVKRKNSTIAWGYIYLLRGYRKNDPKHQSPIYYVGCTRRELYKRLDEHFAGKSRYTRQFDSISLIFYFISPIANIFAVEHYLKTHRPIVYAFVGKITDIYKCKKYEKQFFQWCEAHRIKIIESGRMDLTVIKKSDRENYAEYKAKLKNTE